MSEIKVVNPNTWLYHPDDPLKSYTLTHEKKENCETWIYRPGDNNPAIEKGREGIAYIEQMVSQIPMTNLWSVESDYPNLQSYKNKCGKDYSPISKRPTWIIDNVAFFRRYNDDWSSAVMYADLDKNGGWIGPLELENLRNLCNLLCTKNFNEITRQEIMAVIQ